jgi:hypothetical protein
VTGLWFSPDPLISSTNKTDCHDITEILLKVPLNSIKQTNIFSFSEIITPYLPSNPKCLEVFARNLQPGWVSFGSPPTLPGRKESVGSPIPQRRESFGSPRHTSPVRTIRYMKGFIYSYMYNENKQ